MDILEREKEVVEGRFGLELGGEERTNLMFLHIGQSRLSFWRELRKGSIVKNLLRASRNLDVLVVADYDPLPVVTQESPTLGK